MTYSNGDVYKGNFKDGKESGNGTMRYKNGNVYTGSFKNGLPNGQGTLTYANGTKQTGSFVDGVYFNKVSKKGSSTSTKPTVRKKTTK